jgi:hypothetical protein
MTKLINLTPRDLFFHHPDGRVERFPSSGKVILKAESRQSYMLGGYPVVDPSVNPTVGGLPSPPKVGEIPTLIVSRFAADRVARLWPGEVFIPDTSSESAVRDPDRYYKIVGVRRWERWTNEE